MNKQKHIYLLLLSITCLCTNITNTGITTKNSKQDANNLLSTEKIFKNNIHEIMDAVYMQKKQPLKSFQEFADLTKKNKYAYKWLINFLHKTGNHQKIATIFPLVKSAFPELLETDPDIGYMVSYAICANNITPSKNGCELPISYNKSAIDILIPLNKNFPSHQQVASLTSALYDLNNDPQNAIIIANKYLNNASAKSTDFLEYFKNASRYFKLGDKKNAYKNAHKCTELQPKFPNGWVLLATINDQLDKPKEAINACKKALELSGPNQAIEYMIVRLFFKLKGAQHLANEFAMNKKSFETAIELLRKKEYNKALDYMDKCLSETLKSSPIKDNNNNNNGPKEDELIKIKLIENKKQANATHKICKN